MTEKALNHTEINTDSIKNQVNERKVNIPKLIRYFSSNSFKIRGLTIRNLIPASDNAMEGLN